MNMLEPEFFPIPGWLRPEDEPTEPTLMTDGCPTEYPSWYYVALPVDHPEAEKNPNNLTSYCGRVDAATAVDLYKKLLEYKLPVLGIVRVCSQGAAVEVRNPDHKTNYFKQPHNKDFGSW